MVEIRGEKLSKSEKRSQRSIIKVIEIPEEGRFKNNEEQEIIKEIVQSNVSYLRKIGFQITMVPVNRLTTRNITVKFHSTVDKEEAPEGPKRSNRTLQNF